MAAIIRKESEIIRTIQCRHGDHVLEVVT